MWLLLSACRETPPPGEPPPDDPTVVESTGLASTPEDTGIPTGPTADTGGLVDSGAPTDSGAPPPLPACLSTAWVRLVGGDGGYIDGLEGSAAASDGTVGAVADAEGAIRVGIGDPDEQRLDVDPAGAWVFLRLGPDGAVLDLHPAKPQAGPAQVPVFEKGAAVERELRQRVQEEAALALDPAVLQLGLRGGRHEGHAEG
jgi:hypothetical protein